MIQTSTDRQIKDPSDGWLVCLGWVQSGDRQTACVCCLHLAAVARELCCWCGSAPSAVVKVLNDGAEGMPLLLCKILDHQGPDL